MIFLFNLILIISLQAKEVDKICASVPLASCGPSIQCHDRNGSKIHEPSDKPESCYQDGEAKFFLNSKAEKRYYCEYNPPVGNTDKLPLVIWLHGGGGDVKNLYRSTSLATKARSQRFHLIALQARNVKMPFGGYHDGRHIDSYWWDFNIHSSNPDIADMDKLIQTIVAKGSVDTKRIYMMGWSEGGFFSQLYGMIREKYPSPAGHRIAGVVSFSASSPFHRSYENGQACKPTLNFRSNLPIMLVGHSCDILACNEQQSSHFNLKSDTISIERWENILKNQLSNRSVKRLIVQGNQITQHCMEITQTNKKPSFIATQGDQTKQNRMERFQRFRKMREKMGKSDKDDNKMKMFQRMQHNEEFKNRRKIFQRMQQNGQSSNQGFSKKIGAFQGRKALMGEKNDFICDQQRAKLNHLIWPKEQEQLMLNFLFSNQL
jgi:pimeloyl-ACP methyl ester carboxylesterase